MTVQDYGIHKLYMQSDQRKWFHKCSHCGYEQVLDYDKNIKQINPDGIDVVGRSVQPGTFQFVCAKCGKPLDRWYSGHWVTTAPGSGRIHGYQISQMDAVWVSADKLKEEEMRAPSKQFFYNYSLGFPYEDKGATFRSEDIFSHVDDFEKPNDRENYKFVSVGIDWGEHYHSIVTMGMRPTGQIDLMDLTQVPRSVGVEHIEEDLNLVVRKLNQYQPDIICADRGFSGNYVDKLIAYYGIDRVFGVIVRSAKSNGDFNAHFSSDNTVTIDKLTQNLITLGNIKRGDIRFWRGSQTDRSVQTLANHWGNVVIRTDEKEDEATHTIQYSKVILRKGADHYAQSQVYSMVGLDHLMRDNAQKVRKQVEMAYLDPDVFSPDKTDLQQELDLGSTIIDF